ncbi:MAG: exodeoxyribonuclease V subunit gamma [Chitinispirillaceae bacterium]|nr:exodeoxyribonuclease V subunit gamma [Chitinispirillaceae bacterium]
MLHLRFAPSLDLLVPELLAGMRRVWTDPFAPPAVIVPNPAIGTWLKLRLADCPGTGAPLGCIANLEMQTLEMFLWRLLRPADTMRLLDVTALRQVVCALLDEKLLASDLYSSINRYLAGTGGVIDPVKRVQLASRIAREFLEYEYNRPSVWDEQGGTWRSRGIDASWLEKRRPAVFSDITGAMEADERWQRDLYCRVDECFHNGAADRREVFLSLPRLYRMRREAAARDGIPWSAASGTVFLFGVSKMSHFHRTMLVEVSQMPDVDLHLLLTNPCAEFWEDVDTWRSRKYPRKWSNKDASGTAGITPRKPEDYDKSELTGFGRDHALLELWGSAGKENIYLWCPEAEWNFEYTSPLWVESDEPPKDLLHALQFSLLRRQSNLPPPPGGGTWHDDGSLQVLAVPDPARETEELREQILDLVQEKRIGCLNEVAVYLPDPSVYLPHIERVFGAFPPSDPAYIPYNVLGAPGSDSVYAQGMKVFLDIIEGGFDRAGFFALLRNPIVRKTRAVSPDSIAVWEVWAGELGIFRGYNREHRAAMGDAGLAATDAHTFEYGTARLLLGGLAADPVKLRYKLTLDDTAAAEPAEAPVPPYRDFAAADPASVEQFCGLAELLRNDTREVETALGEQGVAAAVSTLLEKEAQWFRDIPDDAGQRGAAEGRVRREFLDALPDIRLQGDLAGRRDLSLREFMALLRECLPEELPAYSRAWTGGVTFAPLRPAMVVPHKVIFVMGLDATAFPGSNDKPGWTLLAGRRIIGDGDQVRENRFAFLDLLHAARERFVLSYRARDMQKEEERQPSSVILELESYLKSQGLIEMPNNEERCTVRHDIPWLVREEGPDRRTWDPSEARLRHLVTCRRSLHRYGTGGAPPADTRASRVNAALLGKFFANPFEYHLSKTLGIELDEQPETMGAVDEPLESGPLGMSSLQKAVWKEMLYRVFPEKKRDEETDREKLKNEAAAAAGRLYDRHTACGKSPEAQLGRMEREAFRQWAKQCAEETLNLKEKFSDHALGENVDLSLGRPDAAGELQIRSGKEDRYMVECRHDLVLVPRNAGGAAGIIAITREGKAVDNPELWLAGVLQWIAEKRAGGKGHALALVQLNRGGGGQKGTGSSAAAMKADLGNGRDINAWLAGLIDLMIKERCSDHLPFAAVKELFNDNWDNITAEAVNEELERDWSAYRCYLEAFKLTEARIPQVDDRELRARAKARFAPMLEKWLHG